MAIAVEQVAAVAQVTGLDPWPGEHAHAWGVCVGGGGRRSK